MKERIALDDSVDSLYERLNAEIIAQAQDILSLDSEDYEGAIADIVERLTAVWFSGYEYGMENRLDESLEYEYEEELEESEV